jgi:hypothetical protein
MTSDTNARETPASLATSSIVGARREREVTGTGVDIETGASLLSVHRHRKSVVAL